MSIVACGRDRKSEALDVLCDAFYNYPVMRYVLADAGADYDAQLRQLIDFFCEARLVRGVPMYAIEAQGQIAAVALVSPPAERDMPAELARGYEDLIAALGQTADTRMECYDAACEAGDPGTPSHYLGVLGARSTHQRQGYGRQLAEHATQLVREDGGSTGLLLNTETEKNIGYYEQLGFHVAGEADAEQLHTWSMFWPTDRTD